MRSAITAAVIALLVPAGCGNGSEEPSRPAVRLTIVDVLDPGSDAPGEGARNLLEVEDSEGERLLRSSWRAGLDGERAIDAIDAEAGEYAFTARAVDDFAVSDERLVESCEGSVTVDPAEGDAQLVLVGRDWEDACEVDPGARLCPEPAARSDDESLRRRAELAFEELPLAHAEDLAEAGGCHIAATSIDGEPQPLTREYDPTRIGVTVRDGTVREISGFG